jgi:pyruvate/2-oxoglutarate dehydrogenase complex dihydrolipoamide acyltransferase (E2) component
MEDGHPRGPGEPVVQPTTVIPPRGNRKDKGMIPPSTPQILTTVVGQVLGRAAPHLALLGWHKSIELYEEVKILKEGRRAQKEQAIQPAVQAVLDEFAKKQSQATTAARRMEFVEKQSQATAAARQLAEGLGVDLSQLKGSGAEGRITVKDVVSAKPSQASRTP